MTLPDRCDVCAWPITPWDEDEPCRCGYCGARVQPWEVLAPADRVRRIRLIAKREALEAASTVAVAEDVL